jgi:hypothetical protein
LHVFLIVHPWPVCHRFFGRRFRLVENTPENFVHSPADCRWKIRRTPAVA